MREYFDYLEGHRDEWIAMLADLCRLPSVSAQGSAIVETATLLQKMLEEVGFSTRLLPKSQNGNPVVYGELRGNSPFTLLLYNHYDVQPAEPMEIWSSLPFEPALREGKIYGRGVSDNKGNIIARLAALLSLRAVRGSLPITVKVCIEGDEEIGSPHMEEFVHQHLELLRADACLWEGGGVNGRGQPEVTLGVKGLLYVEIEARTADRDAHSSWATVAPNAAWRLTWALASLKDAEERVLIDGFYDAVRPPTAAEQAAVEAMPSEEEETTRSLGLRRFLLELAGPELRRRHLFEPTCTIDGLLSGYTGLGPKTVLPAQATAKLDFRLVPDQEPADILAKLRRHLDAHGFQEVALRLMAAERPARTPIDDPFVATVGRALEAVYGRPPVLIPTMAGTGPLWPFREALRLPVADFGIGYPDNRIHAPDENIRLEDFMRGAKAVVALLLGLGRAAN